MNCKISVYIIEYWNEIKTKQDPKYTLLKQELGRKTDEVKNTYREERK